MSYVLANAKHPTASGVSEAVHFGIRRVAKCPQCRDHFAEGDAMHSWAAECLQTVLKIDHQEKENAALTAAPNVH